MATRLTYTSGTRTPELDAAFERGLQAARGDLQAVEPSPRDAEHADAAAHDPLPHIVGGRARTNGEIFERADSSTCRIARATRWPAGTPNRVAGDERPRPAASASPVAVA